MGYSRFKIKKSFPLLPSVSNAAPVLNLAAKARRRVAAANWEINSTDLGFSQHNVVRFRSPEYAT